jgi:hypothetical protein
VASADEAAPVEMSLAEFARALIIGSIDRCFVIGPVEIGVFPVAARFVKGPRVQWVEGADSAAARGALIRMLDRFTPDAVTVADDDRAFAILAARAWPRGRIERMAIRLVKPQLM